ncbi:MAG: hypothetical protein OHK0013_17430 [Sandaracinaceae bacterium]
MSSKDATDTDDDLAPLPGGDGAPPIDFATFVLSLSTTCMIQLGELENPEGGGVDLTAARHTIEILQMLDEKTRNNLTGEEERVLGHVLGDLRRRYVAKVRD